MSTLDRIALWAGVLVFAAFFVAMVWGHIPD